VLELLQDLNLAFVAGFYGSEGFEGDVLHRNALLVAVVVPAVDSPIRTPA
jgi:hypothetical protein